MKEKPIGVFDSGLGGLTAVRELHKILPNEDIIYFGDTGRVPYGSRGRDTLVRYTKQDIAFLLSKNVKYILNACGTASSSFPAQEVAKLSVPYMGVVAAAAKKAADITKNNRVGIIATEATVNSTSFQKALAGLSPKIESVAMACPLFVPLVENGHFTKNDPLATLVVEEYLSGIREAGIDTLIMGCTHYPLLVDAISSFMGDEVTLVDTGREAATFLKEQLEQKSLLNDTKERGDTKYYVSDDPTRFGRLAAIFLGDSREKVATRINIEEYALLHE